MHHRYSCSLKEIYYTGYFIWAWLFHSIENNKANLQYHTSEDFLLSFITNCIVLFDWNDVLVLRSLARTLNIHTHSQHERLTLCTDPIVRLCWDRTLARIVSTAHRLHNSKWLLAFSHMLIVIFRLFVWEFTRWHLCLSYAILKSVDVTQ